MKRPRRGGGGRLPVDGQRARQRHGSANHRAAHRGRQRSAALDRRVRRGARDRASAQRCRSRWLATSQRSPRPYGPIFEAELARARRSAQAPKLRDCVATYHDYRRRIAADAYRDAVACFESVSARQPDVAQVVVRARDAARRRHTPLVSAAAATQALESARAATAKALALDRDDFLANLALTRVQFFDGDPAFRAEHRADARAAPEQRTGAGARRLPARRHAATPRAVCLDAKDARRYRRTPPALCYLAYAVTYLRERRFAEALASALKIDAHNWVVAQAVVAAAAAHSGRRRRRAQSCATAAGALSAVRSRSAREFRALALRSGVLRCARQRARGCGARAARADPRSIRRLVRDDAGSRAV